MKHFLSQQYRDAVAKYKKLKVRFEKSMQEKSHPWIKKKSLYQRLKKLYTRIQRLETQLKWTISAGALSMALTAFSTQESFGQNKFKYIERTPNVTPKLGYRSANPGYPTYPTFADLDGDGDKDLIIGLYVGGALFYQRNDTAGRVYTLIPNTDVRSPFKDAIADMQGYSYFNPSFADMDGDGDLDMIVGYSFGRYDYVTLFKNVDGQFVPFTGAANPFLPVTLGDGYPGIDGGARGEMIDADNDGDLDLFVSGTDDVLGTQYGINVKYYENYENNTGVFEEKTGANNPLDHVNITSGPNSLGFTGYGSLTFADADGDGDLDAYVTEKYGYVYEYKNIGSNVFGSQTLHLTLTFPALYIPYAHTAAFEDLDGDGDLDAIFGDKYYDTLPYKKNNGSGVFTLVDNDVNAPTNTDFDIEQNRVLTFRIISTSDAADFDGDGDLDIVVYGRSDITPQYIPNYLKNNGSPEAKPNLEIPATPPALPIFNSILSIDLVDFDGDGDADLVAKVSPTTTPRYFQNNSNTFTELIGSSNPFNSVSISGFAKIQVIDYDKDGDFDLIAGDINSIRVFRNDGVAGFTELTGTNNPFNDINTTLANLASTTFKYTSPTLVDMDNDGDLDLLFGTFNNLAPLPIPTASIVFFNNRIYYYKNNNGVYTEAPAENPFNNVLVRRFPLLSFVDIDGDGDLDALLGEHTGARLRYFERAGNNFCPKVQEIRRQINTNQSYQFTKEEFREVYSDEPDTENKDFPKIKILIPPAYGKLTVGGEIATFGLEIPYQALDRMIYTPNTGYTGLDNFVWAAYDPAGQCYSNGGNVRFGIGTDVTAINDDLIGSVVVFPNPTQDKFHINLDRNLSGRVDVKLYNTLGGVVHSASYASPEQVRSIDASKLPKGLYILQISNDGKNGIFKLVKE